MGAMSEPVYIGMPPTDRTFDVGKWGEIRCGGPCRDDYARITVDGRPNGEGYVKLQQAGMKAFHDAEQACGFVIQLTGSFRLCATQESLYSQDPSRYAAPATSGHCRGLAIDVSTTYGWWKTRKIKRALADRRWYQTRPQDEPWHWSFGIQV
jgi:hypothetical protein